MTLWMHPRVVQKEIEPEAQISLEYTECINWKSLTSWQLR